MVKIENYTNKIARVRELKTLIESFDAEVHIDAEDLYPENIDKTITTLEGYLNEIGYKEGQTTETVEK
jgi:hypothetical protein